MNDLATRLREHMVWEGQTTLGTDVWVHPEILDEAADHIEAQNKLIEEMREALVGLVNNENYNGEALHDAGVWDAAYTKAISAISKSRQEG